MHDYLTTHGGCTYCFLARFALYPYSSESEREGINVFFAWECLRPLLEGQTAVIIPDDAIFDPPKLAAFIEQQRITRLVVTPSLLESVLDHPGVAATLQYRFVHMVAWFLMGEVVPMRVVKKAAAALPGHVRLVNAYSTWECLDVSYADLLPLLPTMAGAAFAPAGVVMPGCAAVLLGDDGRPVPQGLPGELYVVSPGLASGYLGDDVKTAEKFVAPPAALAACDPEAGIAYRTGDAARLNPDGQLVILGRIDSTVKIRGFKVSLHSVEIAIDGIDGIDKSVVLPLYDEQTKQPKALIAYVVGKTGAPSEATLAIVRRELKKRLPEYAQPRHIIGLEAFPMRQGESRKLDKAALPTPVEPQAAVQQEGAMKLSAFEHHLATVWRAVLNVADVQPGDNFFDLGGTSLAAAKLVGMLGEQLGITLAVVDVYQYSTLAEMAKHCGNPAKDNRKTTKRTGRDKGTSKLAIVGMAGRFSGAGSIEEFWQNLQLGKDSLRRFSEDDLKAKGLDESVYKHPLWVPVGQVLDNADKFDAAFWGIGQREASIMDPQHRVFMEVAWSAMEQAGYARHDNPYRTRTGVFAACGIDGYLVHHLQGGGLKTPLDPMQLFLSEIGNEKDYIATRVSYQLDLGGPAVSVGSACSSALVAVAQAAQAVMSGQCDMAIAGASALTFPNFGYLYEEGLVGSVDGRVRPFDVGASGTLFGDAVGAVVLKRLDDALEDGDFIWAVLSGYGLSNDGRMKAGYTAPSAEAQTRCIVDAMQMAGVSTEQVSYVECHATATHIGDAIELKGLYDAYAAVREGQQFIPGTCALGSVKGNIGHANCAAGITGLIKTVLSLHHRQLPPTINFESINPKLVDFVEHDGSPFRICRELSDWMVSLAQQLPRRAGVSSFGIGGTNAHIILEEAPLRNAGKSDGVARDLEILTLSAKSQTALARSLEQLAGFIEGGTPADVASAAYTLHVARESHPLRVALAVERDPQQAARALREVIPTLAQCSYKVNRRATVAFCFSGQGSQHAGMARGLYESNVDGGCFRDHFDTACAALAKHLGFDPAPLILTADEAEMQRPVVTQCGLFAVEYALATTLIELGITPVAVAGHSIGQYAAAVTAGVLTRDDAAHLVAVRALATERLGGQLSSDAEQVCGGMLSVVGNEDQIREWLATRNDIWLAVHNAPDQLVIAGSHESLAFAEDLLSSLGCSCIPVPVSHPFHSPLMQPVASRLAQASATVYTRRPQLPMTCNLSGGWLGEEVEHQDYWARHVVDTVSWSDNVGTLLRWQPDVILEIGPGNILCGLIAKYLKAQPMQGAEPTVLAGMRPARSVDGDASWFCKLLGRLWSAGVAVDWRSYHRGDLGSETAPLVKMLLPTYPFDGESYWVNLAASIYVDNDAVTVAKPQEETSRNDRRPLLPAPVSSPWLVRKTDRPNATLRMYCFPFAGGSSQSMSGWMQAAPDWLDVVAIELPGRSFRAEEPIPQDDAGDRRNLHALAQAIIADAGDLPVMFCGWSYGAALATELLIGELADLDRSGQLKALVVVGRAPILSKTPQQDADLESFIILPKELQDDSLWKEQFLPVLNADLAADARCAARIRLMWAERSQRPLLNSPLQVHCGLEDASFAWKSADEWSWISSGEFLGTHYYSGGHDFMYHERQRIQSLISDWVAAPWRPAMTSASVGVTYAVQWQTQAVTGVLPTLLNWRELHAGNEADAYQWLVANLIHDDSLAVLVCRTANGDTEGKVQCAGFIGLLRNLLPHGPRGRLVLLLPASASSGAIAGAARAAAHEDAVLRCQCVFAADHPDAGSGPASDDWVRWLAAQALGNRKDRDLWWKDGCLFAQRLAPCAMPSLPQGILNGAGGRYLITGGTGGLGRALVDWLIDRQEVDPARILVLSRNADDAHPRGVRCIVADLADAQGLRKALAGEERIDGIFHLAGVLDDGAIPNQDAARIERVLTPKLALSSLMAMTPQWGTRWVIAYSSTSSLLGAPGQINYAAANGWLDHLAMWCDDAGHPPVVSINWGTWAEAGMGGRNAKALERARQDAERPLSAETAMAALGGVVATLLGDAHAGRRYAVCDVDWKNSPWRDLPLLAALPVGLASVPKPVVGKSMSTNDALPAGDQSSAPGQVRNFLNTYIRRWDDNADLTALGLDSLDFAQLRSGFYKQFGVHVPLSAIAMPNQTLGELVERLADHCVKNDAATTGNSINQNQPQDLAA